MREIFVFYGIAPSYNASKLAELLLDIAINGIICTFNLYFYLVKFILIYLIYKLLLIKMLI